MIETGSIVVMRDDSIMGCVCERCMTSLHDDVSIVCINDGKVTDISSGDHALVIETIRGTHYPRVLVILAHDTIGWIFSDEVSCIKDDG